jgi:hypothetical protein
MKVRDFRASIPIGGYIGLNGHGKTMCMVYDTMPELDAGRHVLSTVRLTDFRNPRPCQGVRWDLAGNEMACGAEVDGRGHSAHLVAHPAYEPLTDFVQLLEASANSSILVDEISSSFSARSSMSLPSPVLRAIKQLRKGDSIFQYTCPSYLDADVALRRVSQGVTFCTGFKALSVDVPGRLWPANRIFRQLTYDAQQLNDLDGADRENDKDATKIRARKFGMLWGPSTGAFDAYDTYEMANTLGWVDESGKCVRCGGTRTARKCKCGESHDEAA